MTELLVTIGIPTYRRPELLRTALESVAAQTYQNIEVLISDNATPGTQVDAVFEEFRARMPRLRYVRQQENIGSVPNFLFLLQEARTPYFMWLADDDAISPQYVESMVKILEAESDAVCACGYALRVGEGYAPTLYEMSHFPQRSALVRVLRFLWQTDDYFYYGLHRTEILRRASFSGFTFPNAKVITNWCYVYLCDVVLSGRVVRSKDPNDYYRFRLDAAKHYPLLRGSDSFIAPLKRFLLRINVHVLKWRKIVQHLSGAALLLAVPVSVLALAREYSLDLIVRGVHKLQRIVNRKLGLPVRAP